MISLRLPLSCCLYAAASISLVAGTWNPDPSLGNVEAHRRLYDIGRAWGDARFDPAANLVNSKPPGPKAHDHPIRESAYYAYTLLATGDPGDRARAQPIIKNVIATQDTRPNSVWRGAFSGVRRIAGPRPRIRT